MCVHVDVWVWVRCYVMYTIVTKLSKVLSDTPTSHPPHTLTLTDTYTLFGSFAIARYAKAKCHPTLEMEAAEVIAERYAQLRSKETEYVFLHQFDCERNSIAKGERERERERERDLPSYGSLIHSRKSRGESVL